MAVEEPPPPPLPRAPPALTSAEWSCLRVVRAVVWLPWLPHVHPAQYPFRSALSLHQSVHRSGNAPAQSLQQRARRVCGRVVRRRISSRGSPLRFSPGRRS